LLTEQEKFGNWSFPKRRRSDFGEFPLEVSSGQFSPFKAKKGIFKNLILVADSAVLAKMGSASASSQLLIIVS